MHIRRAALYLVFTTACSGASPTAALDDAPDDDLEPLEIPCVLATEPITEPYPWFPALDMARIPFHAGSGDFGPQAVLSFPVAPVTTRSVTVHSAAELVSEALIPGTEIIIGTSFADQAVIFGDVTDLDIIVPRGRFTADIIFGSYSPQSTTARVRVRGPTPLSHSGGRVGSLVFSSDPTSDVIIDGVDLNGEDQQGGGPLYYFSRPTDRVAIVNVRGRATGFGSLHVETRDLVVAGSNILTGARTRSQNGIVEGWGMRGGDRVVVFRNYMEGSRYHRVRVHPVDDTTQYTWIAENVFVDPNEARIVSAFDIGASTPGTLYDGIWAQCNLVYAHSTCITPSFDAPSAAYAQFTHNALFGSITQAQQTAVEDANPGHDYLTETTFSPWESPPAYPSPGDPRDIPLPPDDPTDDAALEGTPCPGPM
jgi:hypothetical protein